MSDFRKKFVKYFNGKFINSHRKRTNLRLDTEAIKECGIILKNKYKITISETHLVNFLIDDFLEREKSNNEHFFYKYDIIISKDTKTEYTGSLE